MGLLESSTLHEWLPIILIPVLIISILGLSCWFISRRRNKKIEKRILHRTLPSKTEYLSSPTHNLTTKSLSTSSSHLTNTDKIYLDKLIRTASDRSLWKQNDSIKPRKVPSGQIPQKILFSN